MNKELTKTRQLTRIEKFGATYKLFRLVSESNSPGLMEEI